MKIKHLKEDAFQDAIPPVEATIVVNAEPSGPEIGEDSGIANVIHDMIIDENETIKAYNNAAASMEKYPELVKLMHDLANEEFAHIGELQKALEVVSPNVAMIGNGEVEAEEKLEEPLSESGIKKINKETRYKIEDTTREALKQFFYQVPEVKITNYNGNIVNVEFTLDPYDTKHFTSSVVKKALSTFGTVSASRFKHSQLTNGYTEFTYEITLPNDDSLYESTIKTKDGWTNKGKEGTHGKFKTKKKADAQRKAMYANGYHESLEEDDKLTIGEYVAKYNK